MVAFTADRPGLVSFLGVAVEALEQVAKDARRVPLVELLEGEGNIGTDPAHQVFGIQDGRDWAIASAHEYA